MERILGGASQSYAQSTAAVEDLAFGRTDNLHEVLLQVAQADLSFRLVLEIRNRLAEAYQDIMKMQI
jgi:flagellar hook-basal body complex protein FliE